MDEPITLIDIFLILIVAMLSWILDRNVRKREKLALENKEFKYFVFKENKRKFKWFRLEVHKKN